MSFGRESEAVFSVEEKRRPLVTSCSGGRTREAHTLKLYLTLKEGPAPHTQFGHIRVLDLCCAMLGELKSPPGSHHLA